MKLQGHHNNNTKGASGHHFFPWLNVTNNDVTVQDFQKLNSQSAVAGLGRPVSISVICDNDQNSVQGKQELN